MSTAPANATTTPGRAAWRAPLVLAAAAWTAGIVLDRFAVVPLPISLVAAMAATLAWLFHETSKKPLGVVYLALGIASLGTAWHHLHRHHVASDDVSHAVDHDGRPLRLRGALQSSPSVTAAPKPDPLRSQPAKATTRFVLRVRELATPAQGQWQPVTGRVQVTVVGAVRGVTVGDVVEILARVSLPGEPGSPGEFDYAGFLRDQQITAVASVQSADEVTLLESRWPTTWGGWLAVLRDLGQRALADRLPFPESAIAQALLLGDGSGMAGDDWDKYLRTGVIHVLAISGQHLVVLAGFLWLICRALGMRRRRVAPVVGAVLFVYALLTGGRPPVMRAAWMVLAYVGAVLLRRPIHTANTFALGWIGVTIVNPADVFSSGCQLSFLAVAILIWGIGPWFAQPTDPMTQLLDESRPWYGALGVWLWRMLWTSYAVNAAVWLAVSPLVASRYHLVSPIALLIGPPLVLLTSLALISGFLVLLLAWCPPLAWLPALATQGCLAGCDALVNLGGFGYFFVPDTPTWWLVVFHFGLLAALVWQPSRRVVRYCLAVGVAWLMLGVAMLLWPHRPGEFRCTFVAVGHGGCTVIETPSGEVVVYDSGALSGPDVTRRQVAPLLWSRGIRRIDEVIVSHADLDHFNGLPSLIERFAVGRVTMTPTFAERTTQAVQLTMQALERRGVPTRIVQRGDVWSRDGVTFDVLHPPEKGPAGNENARSLVLLVRSNDLAILLTGDLEGEGMEQVLGLPAPPLDVAMAPHHGSDRSNTPRFAKWARPRVAVSCQAAPRFAQFAGQHYDAVGAAYLATWPHGTVTVRQTPNAAWVETFRTRRRVELR